jgi:retinoblastoma-like protein 1
MESGQIMSNISIVEKDYEEAYQSHGELDERMFINGEVSLMGSVSCGSPDISASKVLTLPEIFFLQHSWMIPELL